MKLKVVDRPDKSIQLQDEGNVPVAVLPYHSMAIAREMAKRWNCHEAFQQVALEVLTADQASDYNPVDVWQTITDYARTAIRSLKETP